MPFPPEWVNRSSGPSFGGKGAVLVRPEPSERKSVLKQH